MPLLRGPKPQQNVKEKGILGLNGPRPRRYLHQLLLRGDGYGFTMAYTTLLYQGLVEKVLSVLNY